MPKLLHTTGCTGIFGLKQDLKQNTHTHIAEVLSNCLFRITGGQGCPRDNLCFIDQFNTYIIGQTASYPSNQRGPVLSGHILFLISGQFQLHIPV